MNVRMWEHPATRRNLATVAADGALVVGPDEGDDGLRRVRPRPHGRAAGDPRRHRRRPRRRHARRAARRSSPPARPTSRSTRCATSPTARPAARAAPSPRRSPAAAPRVTFVTGPAEAPRPRGAAVVEVETAAEMLAAVEAALPADVAIFAAAVADWHVTAPSGSKVKKDRLRQAAGARAGREPRHPRAPSPRRGRPARASSSASPPRPTTSSPTPRAKRLRKGADWIVANDVSPATGIMGGTENAVTLITAAGAEPWPRMSRTPPPSALADRIAGALAMTRRRSASAACPAATRPCRCPPTPPPAPPAWTSAPACRPSDRAARA